MQYATAQQITNAYQALSEHEKNRVMKYAARKIPGTPFYEPLDLLHETLARAYKGTRKWPLHVPFGLFLCLSMRSVSQGSRRSNAMWLNMTLSHEAVTHSSATLAPTQSIEDYLIRLEHLNAAESVVEMVREQLVGDEKALAALEGLLWELTPRQTCAKAGMSAEEFDAARHRVSRRLREAGRCVSSRDFEPTKKRKPSAPRGVTRTTQPVVCPGKAKAAKTKVSSRRSRSHHG